MLVLLAPSCAPLERETQGGCLGVNLCSPHFICMRNISHWIPVQVSANSLFSACAFLKPMRHRKKAADKNLPCRPLVCAVLGEWAQSEWHVSEALVIFMWRFRLSCLFLSIVTEEALFLVLCKSPWWLECSVKGAAAQKQNKQQTNPHNLPGTGQKWVCVTRHQDFKFLLLSRGLQWCV